MSYKQIRQLASKLPDHRPEKQKIMNICLQQQLANADRVRRSKAKRKKREQSSNQ